MENSMNIEYEWQQADSLRFRLWTLSSSSRHSFIGTAPVILGAFYKGYVANGVAGEDRSACTRSGSRLSADTRTPAGLTHAFCDSAFTVWSQTEFPRFAYLFYLSKFYEVRGIATAGESSETAADAKSRASMHADHRHGHPPRQGQESWHAAELPP